MTGSILCPRPEDTLAVGEAVGRVARPGLVVALQGELGAGKTVFAKGVAKGLGVSRWRYVTSPTFALHNVYQGRRVLHHIDLYRVESTGELEGAGLADVLYGSEVCVIEWPDRFFSEFPADRLTVRFMRAGQGRLLEMEASGEVSSQVLEDLSGRVPGFRWREERDEV